RSEALATPSCQLYHGPQETNVPSRFGKLAGKLYYLGTYQVGDAWEQEDVLVTTLVGRGRAVGNGKQANNGQQTPDPQRGPGAYQSGK
ncbi:hypothetical protein HispidOSU_016072, partial [Sigmodon hispidus]